MQFVIAVFPDPTHLLFLYLLICIAQKFGGLVYNVKPFYT